MEVRVRIKPMPKSEAGAEAVNRVMGEAKFAALGWCAVTQTEWISASTEIPTTKLIALGIRHIEVSVYTK